MDEAITIDGRALPLIPRPVPQPLWGQTLRRELGDSSEVGWWLNKVSRPIRRAAGTCELCGADGADSPFAWNLCCDEVWDYADGDPLVEIVLDFGEPPPHDTPDLRPVARLVDLQAVCWRCNLVIHMGMTTTVYPHLVDLAFEHAARVNEVHFREMLRLTHAIGIYWQARSLLSWDITWEGWERLLQEKLDKLRLRREMVTF